ASRHGRLDILLTSHGFPRDRRLEDMTDDDWNQVIGVCLTGTFLCIRESARLMVPQAYGRIIAVASRAWQGNPGQATTRRPRPAWSGSPSPWPRNSAATGSRPTRSRQD